MWKSLLNHDPKLKLNALGWYKLLIYLVVEFGGKYAVDIIAIDLQ